ncbi:Alpha/beta hydrolase fold-1 [Exophiala viscosa]|uniref:Alpha/beta hydrolase fold-1 n=1 Tax=Exophiala viscosa TaxID=2486360 RepID=A0AAN6IFH6_9EURO|nr:Alpha/beta hydrolase fold-1 [Exophiala viscosa]KAI1621890.1 Alpha/beta hydrolase fold-1 [Exophiala viscosa]
MSKQLPTIIIVHGAWHSPEHYELLASRLRSQGYKTVLPRLASVHYASQNSPPPRGLSEDINAVRTAIQTELDTEPTTDVVLLGHSYGSLPASSAIENLDKQTRLKSGYSNGIVAFLVISGPLMPTGTSAWIAAWGGQYPPIFTMSRLKNEDGSDSNIETSMPASPPGPVAMLYHDLPADEAEKYAAMLKPHVFNGHYDQIKFAGYLVVPTYYLICEDDHALPKQFQQMIVDNASKEIAEKGGRAIMVTGIASSHSPFLSRVEETADWVSRCARQALS